MAHITPGENCMWDAHEKASKGDPSLETKGSKPQNTSKHHSHSLLDEMDKLDDEKIRHRD